VRSPPTDGRPLALAPAWRSPGRTALPTARAPPDRHATGSRRLSLEARLVREAGGALRFELVFPGVQGMLRDADEGGEVAGGQAAAAPGVEDEEALPGGQGRGRGDILAGEAAAARRLLKPRGLAAFAAGRGFAGPLVGVGWPGVRGRVGLRQVGGRCCPAVVGAFGAVGHGGSLLAADAACREGRFPEPISSRAGDRISARMTEWRSCILMAKDNCGRGSKVSLSRSRNSGNWPKEAILNHNCAIRIF